MRFEIILTPDAARSLRRLSARQRGIVKGAIETHLRHDPMLVSGTRIKRLRGLARPQYRLQVDEIRVFYDVGATCVEVLAVVSKADANRWLEEEGEQA
jgi:mRNA interferase RelE/StbE